MLPTFMAPLFQWMAAIWRLEREHPKFIGKDTAKAGAERWQPSDGRAPQEVEVATLIRLQDVIAVKHVVAAAS